LDGFLLSALNATNVFVVIMVVLPDLPEGSVERENALINLRNIRWVLARRHLAPYP
jgi:hypothetical protein